MGLCAERSKMERSRADADGNGIAAGNGDYGKFKLPSDYYPNYGALSPRIINTSDATYVAIKPANNGVGLCELNV